MRKLLLTLMLGSFVFQLNAQSIVFNQTQDANHVFRQGKGQVGNLNHLNQIIEAFADAMNVSEGTIEYFLNYQRELRITKQGTHTYEIKLGLNNMYIGGDDRYNNFDLKPYLKPRSVDVELSLVNRNGQETGKRFLFSMDIRNADQKSSVQTYTDNDSLGLSGYRLNVSSVLFHYSNNDVNDFKQQLVRIKNYYEYKRLLPQWNDTLNQISFNDVETLEKSEDFLEIMKERSKEVKDQNLRNYLKQDPDYIFSKLDEFNERVNRKDREYTEAMKVLHKLYYDAGVEQANKGSKDKALFYLGKSIELRKTYGPPHLKVAEIMFELEEYDSATSEVIYLVELNDAETRIGAQLMAKKLYGQRVVIAEKERSQKDYEESLKHYTEAAYLCNNVDGVNCASGLEADIKQTKLEGFNYLIAQANNSFNTKKWADAENRAMAAADFASRYPESYPNASEPRMIIDKVKGEYYKQYIADAKSLMDKGYNKDALEKLETADELERNYNFTRDKKLRDLQVQAAEKVVVEMCDETIYMAEKNEMSKAFKNQRKVKELVNKYNLTTKRLVNNALGKMDEVVLQQDCINSEDLYNRTMSAFLEQANAAEFLEAWKTWDFAVKLATVDKEYCAIDTNGAAKIKVKYQAGYDYQAAIEKARNMVGQTDNRTVISMVADANANLYTEDVQALGTIRTSLGSIALNSGNVEFMADAAMWLAKNKEPEQALMLADKLQMQGYDKNRLKPILYEVGYGLAKRDYRDKKNQKWRALAKSYFAHNKKLKYLKKGYKKGWKRMKRR